jgi:hypothetical protein
MSTVCSAGVFFSIKSRVFLATGILSLTTDDKYCDPDALLWDMKPLFKRDRDPAAEFRNEPDTANVGLAQTPVVADPAMSTITVCPPIFVANVLPPGKTTVFVNVAELELRLNVDVDSTNDVCGALSNDI